MDMSPAKGPFRSIDDIKHANRALGHYWFTPATIRWFRSRVLPGVIGGRYFISSEQYDDDSPRLYTVRVANDDGSIDTVGDFQQWTTAAQARSYATSVAYARRLADDA